MLAGMKSHGVRPDDRLFKMSYWTFGKKFSKAVRRTKLAGKVSVHTLRHTFASHLAMQGVDLASIQQILGHHDVTVTMVYTHLSPEHLAKTVERLPY
jgi:integrase/recombinase XerD